MHREYKAFKHFAVLIWVMGSTLIISSNNVDVTNHLRTSVCIMEAINPIGQNYRPQNNTLFFSKSQICATNSYSISVRGVNCEWSCGD